jgi:hypothetical protein
MFTDRELRMQLVSLYLDIEIGGTGGGCFHYMYVRVLQEARDITGKKALGDAAEIFQTAGEKFTEIGRRFRDAETLDRLDELIAAAAHEFDELASIEDKADHMLSEHVSAKTSSQHPSLSNNQYYKRLHRVPTPATRFPRTKKAEKVTLAAGRKGALASSPHRRVQTR